MKRQTFDTRPRSLLNKGIVGVSPYRLLTRFLSPAYPQSAKRSRPPAMRGLMLSLRSVAVRPANTARRAMAGAAARCLLALSLALGATCASAQTSGIPAAQDTSIDVGVASDRYLFQLNDFAFEDADGNAATRSKFVVEIITVPDRGRLVRRNGTILRGNEDTSSVIPSDFGANSSQNLFWIPPPEAISITPGFASFTYRGYSLSDTTAISSHGTVTINLVLGETTQQVAGGAPTVTGGMGTSYATNAPLTASIYGVEDRNGIDTSTLAWQWQQADIPSSGTSAVSDDAYSDAGAATTGGLTSGFTPRAAHVGKYIRVCASFKDQHPAAADEERCSIGAPVEGTSSGSSLRLRLRLFLEGPLR